MFSSALYFVMHQELHTTLKHNQLYLAKKKSRLWFIMSPQNLEVITLLTLFSLQNNSGNNKQRLLVPLSRQ